VGKDGQGRLALRGKEPRMDPEKKRRLTGKRTPPQSGYRETRGIQRNTSLTVCIDDWGACKRKRPRGQTVWVVKSIEGERLERAGDWTCIMQKFRPLRQTLAEMLESKFTGCLRVGGGAKGRIFDAIATATGGCRSGPHQRITQLPGGEWRIERNA